MTGRIAERAAASPKTNGAAETQPPSVAGVPAVEPMDSAAPDLDEMSVAKLITFFRLLDRWDREAKPPC
jgi:hypothetical protein